MKSGNGRLHVERWQGYHPPERGDDWKYAGSKYCFKRADVALCGVLVEIRRARLKQLGMPPDASYGLRDHVKQELDYAHRIFASHPQWPVVDVSGIAIEETAGIIFELLKERDARARGTKTELL
jgi:hypothetical protein